MGYKLNIRGASSWENILKDLYIEVDNTNWTSTSLSGFLDEVQTALDGKKSRNVVKTFTNYAASAFDVVLVDTTSAVTVTLPASATQGDEIYITDTSGNAASQIITVARNGHNINGLTDNLEIDVDLASVKLIYDNVANGWHVDAGGSYFGSDISDINNPFITLNADFTAGTPTANGGIIMSRGDSDDTVIRWNETSDQWELTNDGTNYYQILTTDDISSIDHGALSGLGDDDHTQYVHTTIDRTITATHTFSPSAAGPPFALGANADGQLVEGLNAEYANGILISSLTSSPTSTSSGDIWFEEI